MVVAEAEVVPVAGPLHVSLVNAPDLVWAGLRSLLVPFRDRVVLCRTGTCVPDVEIFDPTHVGDEAALGDCPRLALVWREDVAPRQQARALGASQVLTIDIRPADLVAAILEEARGRVTAGSWHPVSPCTDSHPGGLTDREVDVVVGICRGRSNSEIADDLFLSINSVKTYIRSAYRKMGVGRRSQAVLWGIEHGYS